MDAIQLFFFLCICHLVHINIRSELFIILYYHIPEFVEFRSAPSDWNFIQQLVQPIAVDIIILRKFNGCVISKNNSSGFPAQ